MTFPRQANNKNADFSNFKWNRWPSRTHAQYVVSGQQYLQLETSASQKQHELEHGNRYTELLRLPYFDVVRHSCVDGMHNLLLGSAKRFLEAAVDTKVMSKNMFSEMQVIQDVMHFPHGVGRVINKIGAKLSKFTAIEWRNWTLMTSLVLMHCLKVDANICQLWAKFVGACRRLCVRVIDTQAIREGHDLLSEYCNGFRERFGSEWCTFNMHLHLHLRDTLLDYGPIYGTWCFAFERQNHVLGTIQTNNRSPEPQIMRKMEQHHKLNERFRWASVVADGASISVTDGSLELLQLLRSNVIKGCEPLAMFSTTASEYKDLSRVYMYTESADYRTGVLAALEKHYQQVAHVACSCV